MSRRWGGGVPNDWTRIDAICEIREVDRKIDLQRQGDDPEYCYFVSEGLLRFYYATESGKELNKCFYSEGDFAADFSANYLKRPSRFSIATIEPSVLVLVPIAEYLEVTADSPDLKLLSEQAMNTLMVRNERREEELLTLSAKERFRKFATNFPTYMERVPQHHVASYLGVTPEFLSKHKKLWLHEFALGVSQEPSG